MLAAEQEAAAIDTLPVEAFLAHLQEFYSQIENSVRVDYKEAGERLARLEQGRALNALEILTENTRKYSDRLRGIQTSLRRVRSMGTHEAGLRSVVCPLHTVVVHLNLT